MMGWHLIIPVLIIAVCIWLIRIIWTKTKVPPMRVTVVQEPEDKTP